MATDEHRGSDTYPSCMSSDFKDPATAATAERNIAEGVVEMIGKPIDRAVPHGMEMIVRLDDMRELLVENTRLREQVTALQTRCTKLAEAERAAKRVGTAQEARGRRQKAVASWVLRCFGVASWTPKERALRVLEEAIELVQAVDVPLALVQRLVTFVYNKPVGDVRSEASGVAVTLLAFAGCAGLDVDSIETDEIERVLALPEEFFWNRYVKKIEACVTTLTAVDEAASESER